MTPKRVNRVAARRRNKSEATKNVCGTVWRDASWNVQIGELSRGRGRPVYGLFEVVSEKLPFEALDPVKKDLRERGISPNGVYVAHDSMGAARYVGRGNVFNRLASHKKAHSLELQYFSFYIVAEKVHEREIETVLIRAGGAELHFNDRKKRVDIQPGNVRDYEAGTLFYERQRRRGRKKKAKRKVRR